ncbi:flagellar filament capping protein FliD [Myxococcota bacterium]|nr:flagellar filament capping protein FliD [Myxococcota bacterium]
MGSVFISGLASGLDTTGIVSQLVEVYSTPQSTLESQKRDAETELDLVEELQSLMEALQETIQGIDTAEELRSVTVANPGTNAVSVTADPETAIAGSYTLDIADLATAETEYSVEGFATADASLGSGTVTLTVGGVVTEIVVDAASGNDTLEDLAAWISENVEGVSAYVMNDGSGTDAYHLVLQGTETGEANDISVSATLGTSLTFTETVAASDAHFSLNGIDIQSASNSVEGLVPGLTFDLSQGGGGPIEIRVEEDVDGMVSNIQGFVDAYNAVIDFFNDQAFDAETGEGTALTGDSLIRNLQSDLASVIASSYPGGAYEVLSFIGFSTEDDGSLALDAEELKEALQADREAVVDLFTGGGNVFSRLNEEIVQALDGDSGAIAVRIDSLNDQIEDLGEQVDDWDRRIADYEARLTNQFVQLELIIAEYQATGDYLTQLFESMSSGSD